MSFELPDSMDDCLYFTRRSLDNNGKIVAWVEREDCSNCGKAKMGKPRGPDGKIKIRATEYECPECKHSESKKEHEDNCTVKVIYTCPFCGHSGNATTPYKRKKLEGVDCYVFECESCKKKIGISKKMKESKKKK
jgi:hypothetical protein